MTYGPSIPDPLGIHIKIVVNDLICVESKWVQYRFPRSKRKRIRRKWDKDRKNFRSVQTHKMIYVAAMKTIFCSSRDYEKVHSQLLEQHVKTK